jgi:hypothetical protein
MANKNDANPILSPELRNGPTQTTTNQYQLDAATLQEQGQTDKRFTRQTTKPSPASASTSTPNNPRSRGRAAPRISDTSESDTSLAASPRPSRRENPQLASAIGGSNPSSESAIDTTSARTNTPEAPAPEVSTPASNSAQAPSMSSQRRAPRSGGRGGAQENGEEHAVWTSILADLETVHQNEKEAKEINNMIFAQETRIKDMQNARKGTS